MTFIQALKSPYFQVGQDLGPKIPQQPVKQPVPPSMPRTNPPYNRANVQEQENGRGSAKSHRSAKQEEDLDDFLLSLGKSKPKAGQQTNNKKQDVPAAKQPLPAVGGASTTNNRSGVRSGRRRWDFGKKSDLFDSFDDFGDLDASVAKKKQPAAPAPGQTKFPALGTVGKKSSFDWDDDDGLFGYVIIEFHT